VEKVKERQESELINNADYGLLNNVAPSSASRRARRATPDDLDELLAKIWKEPAFFLAHHGPSPPSRECTQRGVPPPP